MILLLLSLTALFISPSWGRLDTIEFESYLDPMCVSVAKDEQSLVNGQEHPLSQTLENFIALAEKFEMANPNYGLKNELFYFIRNYTYDNVEYSSIGDVSVYEMKEANFDIVNRLWEPDDSQRHRLPEARDPFQDNEKCSLYYMLSHSIIRAPRKFNVQRAYNNNTRYYNNDIRFNLDEMYPIETGVVAVLGSESPVDLGRVLRGVYVGLNENRKVSIDGFERIPKNVLSVNQEKLVDPLYTLTLAEVIALASWRPEVSNRIKFPATEGWWASNDPDTKDICPMLYRHKNGTMAAYSQSSLRGAADGFILGRITGAIEAKHRSVKLSQILKMYYSRGGISSKDDLLGNLWASFCNREAVIAPLEDTLRDQVRLYQILVAKGYKNIEDNLNYAMTYYKEQKSSIFNTWNTALDTYCKKSVSVNDVNDLPMESPLDIIAVLDTSGGEENYRKQQLILGYMAKELDLHQLGSRMTILTDQKDITNIGSTPTGEINLNALVVNTHSSACAACSVVQIPRNRDIASAPEDEVIIAIDQLLQQKKNNETKKSGVEGKVVIYFNFQDEGVSTRPTALDARIDKALRDIHIRHIEVPMYAVGKDTQVIKKYARNDGTFVMSAVDESESVVGKKLYQRVSAAPATLQYEGCETGNGENTAIYEDFVSPNAIQHWAMAAKYFYKSRNLKLTFEANYGPIKVCHSRATFTPEQEKSTCNDIENGQKFEYRHSNPCKNYNDISCSPFYFAVLGVNNTEAVRQDCIDTNSDNQCRTLDQIKFKVSHEGIRCSGSSAILAVPVLILLLTFIQSIFSKRF